MKDSLKSILFEEIKKVHPGHVTLDRVYRIAIDDKKKISNAERRLRELSHDRVIAPVFNDKKTAIIGYKYIPQVVEVSAGSQGMMFAPSRSNY